jgi:excisionase family DNA binding protein
MDRSRDVLLTVPEVADYLRVDPETVRRWLRAGQLPGINLGRAGWRIRENDLDKFVCERERGT